MKYTNNSFRQIYRQFLVCPLTDVFKEALANHPHIAEANCVLAYAFADVEEGLSLEIITCGEETALMPKFFPVAEDINVSIPLMQLGDFKSFVLVKSHENLASHYAAKLENINPHIENTDLELIRQDDRLDHLRDEFFIDEMIVEFFDDNDDTMECQVRIEGIYQGTLVGTLLEDASDCGHNIGDFVHVIFATTDDDEVVLLCESANSMVPGGLTETDFTPNEAIEVGAEHYTLKDALMDFNRDQSDENFDQLVLKIYLCEFFLPCYAYKKVFTPEEMEGFKQYTADGMAIMNGEDLIHIGFKENELLRVNYNTNEVEFYMPDLIVVDDDEEEGRTFSIMPFFSSIEEAGGYEENITLMPIIPPFIKKYLEKSTANVECVVFNPLSDEVPVTPTIFTEMPPEFDFGK